MKFPDFICIGAQKSGTTWLFYQMKIHKEIWVPPVKELHFFDRIKVKFNALLLFEKTRKGKSIRHIIKSNLFRVEYIVWLMYFLFQRRDIKNYKYLFRPKAGQKCGDVTPAYARVSPDLINEFRSHHADCKIIYLLRNPVERAWSQINMFKQKNGSTHIKEYTDIIQYKKEQILEHSNYKGNLLNWQNAFGKENIFLGYFEEIKNDPEELLGKIYNFIGVDSSKEIMSNEINVARNKGNSIEIPLEYELYFSKLLLNNLKDIHSELNTTYTKNWLDRALKIIEENKVK